jgi:class 3 adenylate cyclase
MCSATVAASATVTPVALEDAVPETRFARLGDDRIAYQVFGEGDVDLLYSSATGDPIDLRWEWPAYASFLRRLGQMARVITFDRRGSGSSDNPSDKTLPLWERWADEARAVADTVESERAVFLGDADGGPIAIMFAASHPGRTQGLIVANSFAGGLASRGDEIADFIKTAWGTPGMVEFTLPDAARDPAFVRWSARGQRLAFNPRDARAFIVAEQSLGIGDVLPSVRVPTLVLHREGCLAVPLEWGREVAAGIPGARFVTVPGRDSVLFTDPEGEALRHIEEFLTGDSTPPEPDRALAAILFTDIVASTERVTALGDQAWRDLIESHDVLARTVVEQQQGRLMRMTGDGVLATFDGPGRAIRCAFALGEALRPLGLEIRAGLHTGEVEFRSDDLAGIAVHIAARVVDAAGPGEVLVSAAVPMLVAGSGFEFDDRGERELKGVPGVWRLFAVRA